jgi:hypothetical protein
VGRRVVEETVSVEEPSPYPSSGPGTECPATEPAEQADPHELPHLGPAAAAHIRFVQKDGSDGAPGETVVERFFPAPHHSDERFFSPQEAERAIEESAVHFRELGVRTPTVRENTIVPVSDGYRIESEVEYVPHRPLIYADEATGRGAIRPGDEHVTQQVIEKLADYYKWVKTTGQPRCLADASRIQQYGVTPDGEAVLPDTDPYMQPATDYALSMNMVKLLMATSVLPDGKARDDVTEKILTTGIPFLM